MRKFLPFLFLFSTVSYGQSIQESYSGMEASFTGGDYATCIEHCNSLMTQCAKDDTTYWNMLSYLAFSHFYLQDYSSACFAQSMERDLRKKFQGTDHEYYLSATFYLGVFSSYAADYETSIRAMEEVKMPYKNILGEKSDSYLNVLRSLAGLYDQTGSDYLAEKYYDTLYALAKTHFNAGDEMLRTVSNSASAFYTLTGAFEKAEVFFLDAVTATEELYGPLNDTSLASFNSLGEFYIYAGWYEKAEEVYLEFLTRCAKHYGKKSADYGTALNNLAVAYEKQNKYIEAEKCYLECLKVKGNLYTYESAYYALSLQNLAVLYDNMGRQTEAEELLNQAISIYERVYTDHENYAVALNNLSSIYSTNGHWDKAIEIQKRSCEIQKTKFGENSAGYVNALGNLAQIYLEGGDVSMADSLMQESATRKKTILGENHPDYAITLCNLGNIKSQQGQHRIALDLFINALNIQANTIGTADRQYAVTLSSMAAVYHELGDFQKSQKMYETCYGAMKRAIGERDPEFATVLCNFGLMYQESGELDKSELLLNQAYGILADARGLDHPDLIYPLTGLARIYVLRNYYEKAENYLNRAMDIASTYYGARHPSYTSLLGNFGEMYTNLGQFDRAEKYYRDALESQSSLSKRNIEYAANLNNLATLFLERAELSVNPSEKQRDLDSALVYLNEALRTDTLLSTLEHGDHAGHLNNIAQLYLLREDFTKAENLFLHSLELEKKFYGPEELSVAITYNNLGLVYERLKNFPKALEFANHSLEIKSKVYGSNSTELVYNYLSLATLHDKSGNPQKSLEFFNKSIHLNLTEFDRNLGFLTEEGKEQFYKTHGLISPMYYNFILNHPDLASDMYDLGYTSAIMEKGILLRSNEKLKNSIFMSGNPELMSIYERWISKKQELTRLLGQDQRSREATVSQIEAETEALEKELISRSADFRAALSKDADLATIKSALNAGEAAIEFVIYSRMDSIRNFGHLGFAAMILRHDAAHPIMVELGTEAEIFAEIMNIPGTTVDVVRTMYGGLEKRSEKLFNQVWAPLEKYLTGIQTVYFSPVGVLNQISFSALRGPSGAYITEKYQLFQVATTAQIDGLKTGRAISRTDELCVFGGAEFSTENSTKEVWSYLEGTKNEADQIYNLAVASNLPCRLYTGLEASELNIKDPEITGEAEVIHIATHGFFYQMDGELEIDVEESAAEVSFRGSSGAKGVTAFIKNPNPLMRSGLVFSGANNVWNPAATAGGAYSEDGVLTAMEVANLNLDHVKLVVLSACETGLGDNGGTQGVYGLQRAFKIAGVDKMIMSLWQVPDKETAEFMVLLYKNLLVSFDVHSAFSKAQTAMRVKYEPYYWAAFVLVE